MSIHAVHAWRKSDAADVVGGRLSGKRIFVVPVRIFGYFFKVREVKKIEFCGVFAVLELAFVTGYGLFKVYKYILPVDVRAGARAMAAVGDTSMTVACTDRHADADQVRDLRHWLVGARILDEPGWGVVRAWMRTPLGALLSRHCV